MDGAVDGRERDQRHRGEVGDPVPPTHPPDHDEQREADDRRGELRDRLECGRRSRRRQGRISEDRSDAGRD